MILSACSPKLENFGNRLYQRKKELLEPVAKFDIDPQLALCPQIEKYGISKKMHDPFQIFQFRIGKGFNTFKIHFIFSISVLLIEKYAIALNPTKCILQENIFGMVFVQCTFLCCAAVSCSVQRAVCKRCCVQLTMCRVHHSAAYIAKASQCSTV